MRDLSEAMSVEDVLDFLEVRSIDAHNQHLLHEYQKALEARGG